MRQTRFGQLPYDARPSSFAPVGLGTANRLTMIIKVSFNVCFHDVVPDVPYAAAATNAAGDDTLVTYVVLTLA